jgi:KDO2-lipid IV(A) lauroyltransferase
LASQAGQPPTLSRPTVPDRTVTAYSALATLARWVPPPAMRAVATLTGPASRAIPTRQMAARRRLAARHQRRVSGWSLSGPALEMAVDATMASYVRYWTESLRLPTVGFSELDAGMSWEGMFDVETALQPGRGLIMAMPHLGGWEWGGMWLTLQGFPMTVVVEALEPPELFEWFAGFRRSLGMNVVPVGPSAGTAVLRALADGHIVCLLSDRHVGDTAGVQVTFFDELTTLPAGAATVALRTGAPLMPAAVYFSGRHDGHFGIVRPPLETARTGARLRDDVQRVTQLLAGELELLIRRAPTQWHLMQPNWPSDPGYGV